MENQCFIDELAMISIGRGLVTDFDYRLWEWVQAAGLDISPYESTNQLIARLDDQRLVSLSNHVKKQVGVCHG